jgi:hypothetical protein
MPVVAVPRNHLMPKARDQVHYGNDKFLERGTSLERGLRLHQTVALALTATLD